MTPPSNIETLQNFYKKIQPGGPGWKKIIDISESNGIKIVGQKGEVGCSNWYSLYGFW